MKCKMQENVCVFQGFDIAARVCDCISALLDSVAYLGFPAPGGKLSFGVPTQPVHGSIGAKNESGVKGRRKLTRALQSLLYSCF